MYENQAVWDDQALQCEIMAEFHGGNVLFFQRDYYDIDWRPVPPPDPAIRRKLVALLRRYCNAA